MEGDGCFKKWKRERGKGKGERGKGKGERGKGEGGRGKGEGGKGNRGVPGWLIALVKYHPKLFPHQLRVPIIFVSGYFLITIIILREKERPALVLETSSS